MSPEFDLIRRYFQFPTRHTELGVGDDGALIRSIPGNETVVSTDMLVAGTHFFADTNAEGLGWKTLAVNISDMAAMGAQPRWAVLAMAIPDIDERWIADFARGLFACAEAFGVDLIGGDTTRGPLTLCVTIIGEVPPGCALLRDGARSGDDVWISGHPGRAALGLAHLKGEATVREPWLEKCLAALYRPQPRVALGLALRGVASSALDVSDGMLGDLQHILERSQVGAEVDATLLPRADLDAACHDASLVERCMFAGGDDYELLFTAPVGKRDVVEALAATLPLALTRIGHITENAGLSVIRADGTVFRPDRLGYDHFQT